ncbi:MAG: hypothetical protein KC410_19800 [Anaerolineales bacterium]|uniref:hypothetical protein n=1 Tax=Promineifilum sp. TaxID=2664178 RepID=UPI001E0A00B2|nr:hypothetical protein [Anaerolineales bacterium]MCO5181128.1 hypothetical protein [Promineifilum sp.]
MATSWTTKEVAAALAKLECSVENLEKECRERAAEQAKVVNKQRKVADELVDAIVGLLMFVLNTGKDEEKIYGETK